MNSKCPLNIRLNFTDLEGNDKIALTPTQFRRLEKARANSKGVTLKFTSKQLRDNVRVEGGFLGMLAGLASTALPALAKTILPALGVGALSGLASAGAQKAIGSGLYLKRGGIVAQVETDGEGLYLKPYSQGKGFRKLGNGLYLKRGGKIYDGSGLLLGQNSPFANIPILGAIL